MNFACKLDTPTLVDCRRWAVVALAATLLLAGVSSAADRVVGANATLDMEPGARSAALGSATMAVDGDYLGLTANPYQLANVNYAWASFSHTEYYEDTKFDFASAAIPLSEGQGIGVSFSRFAADDIPYIREGEPLPEGSDYKTLSIADWVAGLRFRAVDSLFVSAMLKGWTSSATTWESGEFEYSAPEVYLAVSYSLPVAYLYGKLNFYWQGAGLFHHEARALDFETDEEVGGPIWESPLDWLSGGRGGIEFAFDFGLSVRAGLSSFTTFKSFTAGAGLVIAKFLKVDYAFESHPVFSPVHRVSISVSPYLFARAPRPKPKRDRGPSKYKGSLLEEEPHPEESAPEAPAAEQAQSEAAPAAPVVEDASEEVLKERPAGGTYWEE